MARLQRPALCVAVALILLAAACIGMRLRARETAQRRRGGDAWQLTYDVDFRAAGPEEQVRIALPQNSPQATVLREVFSCTDCSMGLLSTREDGTREAIVTRQDAVGRPSARFVARFDIETLSSAGTSPIPLNGQLRDGEAAQYLQPENEIQSDSPAALEWVSRQPDVGASAKDIADGIFEYCSKSIFRGATGSPSDAAATLERRSGSALGRARAMVALCRASRLPARLATGFVLHKEGLQKPHVWAEVRIGEKWVPYDLEWDRAARQPPAYLPVRRGGFTVTEAAASVSLRETFSVVQLSYSGRARVPGTAHWQDILDLRRLSPGAQKTLALILLIPVGALVTSVSRNLIGVETSGTFTPILLALSFVYADWRSGIVVLVTVLAIGLAGRVLLNRLKLLMVPRLSVVLTLVVVSLTVAVSALDYLEVTPVPQAVLLPMVIVTMTVERFHISAEEDGVRKAFGLLAGTLGVGGCALAIFRLEGLGHFLLHYPEVQFLIMGVLILIGRYAGYRLTELWRFRDVPQTPDSGEGR